MRDFIKATFPALFVLALIPSISWGQASVYDLSQPPGITSPETEFIAQGMRFSIISDRAVSATRLKSGKMSIAIAPLDETSQDSRAFPVLIYNYDYAAYGLMTGEVVFKFTANTNVPNALAAFPGASRVGTLDIYSIRASNPSAIPALYRQLGEIPNVEWIEPMIEYPVFE